MDKSNTKFPADDRDGSGDDSGSQSVKKTPPNQGPRKDPAGRTRTYKITPKKNMVVQFNIGIRHFVIEPGTWVNNVTQEEIDSPEMKNQLPYVRIKEQ